MSRFEPDLNVLALGVRQPWVELILRGVKSIEVRTQNTQVRGTIYLYASKKFSEIPAAQAAMRSQKIVAGELPTGLLVGSVEIVNSRRATSLDTTASCVPAEILAESFAWELRNPQRFSQPAPVQFLPYGVWFYPFKRRGAE